MPGKKSDKSAGSAKRSLINRTRSMKIQNISDEITSNEIVEEARPIGFDDLTFRQRRLPFQQLMNRMKILFSSQDYTTEKEEQCKRQNTVRQYHETCEENPSSIRTESFRKMETKLSEYIEELRQKRELALSENNDVAIVGESEIEYMVEKICSKQRWNNILRYECKWQNYSSEENTFEVLQHLDNSLILVKHYENSLYKRAQNKIKINVQEIEDKINQPIDAVWKSLKHLKFPEEILAYDTWTGTCWVSFKNIGETAKIHCSEMKRKYPDLWIKFFKEHRNDFKRGRVRPTFSMTKQPNMARPRIQYESGAQPSTSRGG